MPEPALLAELPEAQADGETRRIYREIRRCSAVPMVALIYRHLATMPGVLEWAWAAIGPLMQSGELPQRAWQLAAAAHIPGAAAMARAALRSTGITQADEGAIVAVLDAYNRANPVNILAVRCLAHLLRDEGQGARARPDEPVGPAAPAGPVAFATATAWQSPPEPAPLPSMLAPQAMGGELRALVLLLTDRNDGRAPSPLWPSLYRHLANWPALLAFASVVVPPEFVAIDAAAARLRAAVEVSAAELARRLAWPAAVAAPAGAERLQLLQAIDRFSQRIPEMVVIGGLLRRAMPATAPPCAEAA